MENFTLDQDIKVFYVTAKSYPEGILEAHQTLHALVPLSPDERRFFGLSRPEGNRGIIYRAAAEELIQNEALQLGCESLIIKKGQYHCITVHDYMKDVSAIGKAFQLILAQKDLDPHGYCVEWYVDHKDVKCMVRLNA